MLYNDNSIYYDRRDLRFLWDKPLSYADKDIGAQQKKTQEASDELKESSNSYEMTTFNGMSQDEAAVLERRVDKLPAEYKRRKRSFKTFTQSGKDLKRKDGMFRLIFLSRLENNNVPNQN